ncbi:hypothetical protein VR7878_01145 [Vibrio ruber DSM 16370]|uniref:Uncharacterized protein n=1 Tax=Vibrio ruber (strain DSM 16370 / JCM 11486 / BCRC 17186 / CECT 7878 / LMG 23124 / VR1) TaxID=1123498 RepID=A0A1R4LF87_VIBR1|nr:hypothetical protein [Vibrio ruber]SJN55241.1 hypothetical protein VR7878_01145 [Vibrio ruber DSM 16370]
MVSGIEAWLFGYAGTKLADRVLKLFLRDKLTVDLHKAVEKWASNLPSHASLTSSNALFPSHVADEELAERHCLSNLRSELESLKIPSEESWDSALTEQWKYVRSKIDHPQDFFLLSEEEASTHIKSLSIALCTACSQHETLFRVTTVSMLRELSEAISKTPQQNSLSEILTDDQKKLLYRLYHQDTGLCRIAAPKGEYECLWVPGYPIDMQWGWERTPEECRRSGKSQGNREERLHWIFVVKDLVEIGIFEARVDGYYQLTEKGWRVAHDINSEKSDSGV